jgi:hypothetical protein
MGANGFGKRLLLMRILTAVEITSQQTKINTMVKVIMMTKIIVKVLGMIDNTVHRLIPLHHAAITIIGTIITTTRAQIIGKTMFKSHLHLRHI